MNRSSHLRGALVVACFLGGAISAAPAVAQDALETRNDRVRFALTLLEETKTAEGTSGLHYRARSGLELCGIMKNTRDMKSSCEEAQTRVDACMKYVADWKQRKETWIKAATTAGESTDGYRGLEIKPCPYTVPQTDYTPAQAIRAWAAQDDEDFRLKLCAERTWPDLSKALEAEDIASADQLLRQYEGNCLTWLNGRTRPTETESARVARAQLDALKEKKRAADAAAAAAAAKAAEVSKETCKAFETIAGAFVAAGRVGDLADVLKTAPPECTASVANAMRQAAARVAAGAGAPPPAAAAPEPAPAGAGAGQASSSNPSASGPDPFAALPRRGGVGGATGLMRGIVGSGGGAGTASAPGAGGSGGGNMSTMAGCKSAAEATPEYRALNGIPRNDNVLMLRGVITALDAMIPVWRQCTAPQAPANVSRMQEQRQQSMNTCQQIAASPQSCSQPYRP